MYSRAMNLLRKSLTLLALFSCGLAVLAEAPQEAAPVKQKVAEEKDGLLALYRDLHSAPELSFQEEKTSARLAQELRAAGFTVTEKIGKWGVVAVLENGQGKTVLVRSDMDALPVHELTGLPFASTVRMKDHEGKEMPVMHACGHDIHMTCLVGVARVLASMKDRWHGTLVLIAQPAEERGGGALAMLKDGLFKKFPKPDLCLALHDTPEIPTGQIGLVSGTAMASVDSVDLIVHGVGGHGAMPDQAKDPIVLSAQIILGLQTIRSRELAPIEGGVVTVGAINGGTKHNIIPDEVRLQITVRAFSMETRTKILTAIKRIARGQAISAGLPEELMPEMKIGQDFTPALVNDAALASRLRGVFTQWFGAQNVQEPKPIMGGEDFSRYGMTEDKIPVCMFWLGATLPERYMEFKKKKEPLPGLHSPFFKPDADATVPFGITAMSAAVLDVMK